MRAVSRTAPVTCTARRGRLALPHGKPARKTMHASCPPLWEVRFSIAPQAPLPSPSSPSLRVVGASRPRRAVHLASSSPAGPTSPLLAKTPIKPNEFNGFLLSGFGVISPSNAQKRPHSPRVFTPYYTNSGPPLIPLKTTPLLSFCPSEMFSPPRFFQSHIATLFPHSRSGIPLISRLTVGAPF